MAIDANVAVGRDFWRESFTTLGVFVDLLLDTATAYATAGSRGAVAVDVCGVFRVLPMLARTGVVYVSAPASSADRRVLNFEV
jgi:hypothetical protein